MMLRQNFRERSGIVVDVCAGHGVWFDRREFAKLIEFAATGALAKAERDIADQADARKRLEVGSGSARGRNHLRRAQSVQLVS